VASTPVDAARSYLQGLSDRNALLLAEAALDASRPVREVELAPDHLVAPLVATLDALACDAGPLLDMPPAEALEAGIMALYDLAHSKREVSLVGAGATGIPEFYARVRDREGVDSAIAREDAKARREEAYSEALEESRELGWPTEWRKGEDVPIEWLGEGGLGRYHCADAYRWLLTAKVTKPRYVKAQEDLLSWLRIAPGLRKGLKLGPMSQASHSLVVSRYNRDQREKAGGLHPMAQSAKELRSA